MSLCETCARLKKDYEIGVSLKPDDVPHEFKTYMICELNVSGFPFKKACTEYDQLKKPE